MIRLPYSLRRAEGRPCKVPHWGGLRYWFECHCENYYINRSGLPESGINTDRSRKTRIIASLTSFPQRIPSVFLTIKSLMLQSVKADRIVLWLAQSQFNGIPDILRSLIERGLTVRFCDDLRSHKKYFYALQEQHSDEVVITYDDDIIYEHDSIKSSCIITSCFPTASSAIEPKRFFSMTRNCCPTAAGLCLATWPRVCPP